jgi:hypothetical protein
MSANNYSLYKLIENRVKKHHQSPSKSSSDIELEHDQDSKKKRYHCKSRYEPARIIVRDDDGCKIEAVGHIVTVRKGGSIITATGYPAIKETTGT